MNHFNVYDDPRRAASYAALEFPGTYYLAYRDLPALLATHVRGTREVRSRAMDFGCGTGRSTRFLRGLGYDVTGVDISAGMIEQARARDPSGDYRLIADGGLEAFAGACFDLVLAAFTFDNIPGFERKRDLFRALGAALGGHGRIVTIVSTPEIYVHEWASFSTRDYPGNRAARRGDPVQIVMTDVEDRRPVVDIVWPDDAYREVCAASALEVEHMHLPLGREDEPIRWVNETRIAPWAIYVLKPASAATDPRRP